MMRAFLSLAAVTAMLMVAAADPTAAQSQGNSVAVPSDKVSKPQSGQATVQKKSKLKATKDGRQCDQARTMTAIALAESGGNAQPNCK